MQRNVPGVNQSGLGLGDRFSPLAPTLLAFDCGRTVHLNTTLAFSPATTKRTPPPSKSKFLAVNRPISVKSPGQSRRHGWQAREVGRLGSSDSEKSGDPLAKQG